MDVGEVVELTEYQRTARETAVYSEEFGVFYTALGLAGEAGEVANVVKKIYRDDAGHVSTESLNRVRSELGDVLWYVAALASDLGLSLEDIAWGNIEKLRERSKRNTLKGSGDKR